MKEKILAKNKIKRKTEAKKIFEKKNSLKTNQAKENFREIFR